MNYDAARASAQRRGLSSDLVMHRIYFSDWGDFEIPEKYFGLRWNKHGRPDKRVKSQSQLLVEFYAWLEAEEVKAGKP